MEESEKKEPIEVASDMTPSELMRQLHNPETKFAFLLGNGINRYAYRKKGIDIDVSWKSLLREAASKLNVLLFLPSLNPQDESLSLIEYYSLLELESGNDEGVLQKTIKSVVEGWRSTEIHKRILDSLRQYNRPVVTTNIDTLLHGELNEYEVTGTLDGGNTSDEFPIHKYWACGKDDSFRLWHLNGVCSIPKSLKFGLVDYSKLTYRVSRMIDGCEKEKNTYVVDKMPESWVKTMLSHPLCIVGLGLNEEEVFLRYLLLRKRHLKHHGTLGWYCYTKEDKMPYGKSMLLRHMGISPVMFSSYDEMYTTLFPAISKENDKGCNNTFQQR